MLSVERFLPLCAKVDGQGLFNIVSILRAPVAQLDRASDYGTTLLRKANAICYVFCYGYLGHSAWFRSIESCTTLDALPCPLRVMIVEEPADAADKRLLETSSQVRIQGRGQISCEPSYCVAVFVRRFRRLRLLIRNLRAFRYCFFLC
jgi:hypothetical protein